MAGRGHGALARMRGCVDPVVLLVALLAVLAGTVVGLRGDRRDVDEAVFRSTILRMQHGVPYYDAFVDAIVEEKQGIAPSTVRSIRTPVVSYLLTPLPEAGWRWAAGIPAVALCLAAAALAGPDLLAQRLAAGLCGAWMVVSLPYLYLHAELWGAPLVLAAGLLARGERDGPAAAAALVATAMRELFVLSLLAGLAVRRRRAPWIGALGIAVVGALVHAHWARAVLDPDGFDPPLRAVDTYLAYLSPGETGAAQVLGVILLALAGIGVWLRRGDPAMRLLVPASIPLIVGGATSGRAYWTLAWCGVTSAAGAVALATLAHRAGWASTDGEEHRAPYPAA